MGFKFQNNMYSWNMSVNDLRNNLIKINFLELFCQISE